MIGPEHCFKYRQRALITFSSFVEVVQFFQQQTQIVQRDGDIGMVWPQQLFFKLNARRKCVSASPNRAVA